MNQKSQEPATKPAPDTDRYMPGDPIPVPHAVEADSESAWAHFSGFPDTEPPDFADTVPVSVEEGRALAATKENPA
jgi:hypothetical protein